MRAALRRPAAVLLLVWAIAFSLLAAAYALPTGPTAVLAVSDSAPFVGETISFDGSGSIAHDAGNGRIVAYDFAFGDGAATGWIATAVVGHAYNRTGSFTAALVVRDDRGMEGFVYAPLRVRTPPSAPDLVLAEASAQPAEPRVGDLVTVTVTVLNQGNETAMGAAVAFFDLRPNGMEVPVDNETLPGPLPPAAGMGIESAAFTMSEPGNHTVRIVLSNVTPPELGPATEELDLPMTVLAVGAPVSPAGFGPVAAVLSVAAGVSLAAALYLLRRKPPGPLEPPPPSPPDQSPPPIWPP